MILDLFTLVAVTLSIILSTAVLIHQKILIGWHKKLLIAQIQETDIIKSQLAEVRKQNELMEKIFEKKDGDQEECKTLN